MTQAWAPLPIAIWLVAVAVPAHAAPCPPARDIYVGGVTSLSTLADPTASAMLRATGRVGLYTHGAGVNAAFYSHTLPLVYRAFANTGSGIGEVGYAQLRNDVYMNGAYLAFYDNGGAPVGARGQRPWAMLDNAPDDFLPGTLSDGSVNVWNRAGTTQTVDGWRAELAAARAHGIGMVVPIISPNDDVGLGLDPATAPDWALARDVARAMGSIGIDAPPHYVFTSNVGVPGAPGSYQAWLVRFVRWAEGEGLRVFWIVSPNQSGAAFLADTQMLVAFLEQRDALPHHWIVENYDFPNTVAGAVRVAGGHGYTRATVMVSPPGVSWGTQATMNATIVDGAVAALVPVDQGSGYTAASVTVFGDGEGARFTPVVTPDDGGMGPTPPGIPTQPSPSVVGTETLPGSVAAIALWMAQHAPVRAFGGCPAP